MLLHIIKRKLLQESNTMERSETMSERVRCREREGGRGRGEGGGRGEGEREREREREGAGKRGRHTDKQTETKRDIKKGQGRS